MITFREMTEADIPAGLSLCRSAGWNQLENDWRIFISLSKYGNRVAINDDGKVVGTVATISYEDLFSWIGMVLVDPSSKRQGIGTQLLRQSLELLNNQDTIKLDATPAGREVYLKLDFKDEYVLSRMMGTGKREKGKGRREKGKGRREKGEGKRESANVKGEGSDLKRDMSSRAKRGIDGEDKSFNIILETDKAVFGASRKELLKTYSDAFPELSFIENSSNYCFGRRGFNFTQIGPVVADNVDEAVHLTSTVLQNIDGPVVLDVMENSPFSEWLYAKGFTEQRKLIRMYRGKNAYPGLPGKQFAILGPEFG